LELADVVRETGLSRGTLNRLIAAGEFPRACKITDRIRLWPWSDVVWWKLSVELKGRLVVGDVSEMEPEEENLAPTGAHGSPREPKRPKT
jgi:predicted DNA-binding transcriptional regulator AlpA